MPTNIIDPNGRFLDHPDTKPYQKEARLAKMHVLDTLNTIEPTQRLWHKDGSRRPSGGIGASHASHMVKKPVGVRHYGQGHDMSKHGEGKPLPKHDDPDMWHKFRHGTTFKDTDKEGD